MPYCEKCGEIVRGKGPLCPKCEILWNRSPQCGICFVSVNESCKSLDGIKYCKDCWCVRPRTSVNAVSDRLRQEVGITNQETKTDEQTDWFSKRGIPNVEAKEEDKIVQPQKEEIIQPQKKEERKEIKKSRACVRCLDLESSVFYILPDTDDAVCDKCFLCDKCLKPMEEGKFVRENDLIVHPNCVHRDPCLRCQKPIDGKYISKPNGKIHASCFTCNGCQSPLGGVPYYLKQSKEFCETCSH